MVVFILEALVVLCNEALVVFLLETLVVFLLETLVVFFFRVPLKAAGLLLVVFSLGTNFDMLLLLLYYNIKVGI